MKCLSEVRVRERESKRERESGKERFDISMESKGVMEKMGEIRMILITMCVTRFSWITIRS